MITKPEKKSIAYDISIDFTLRGNNFQNYDAYFLDFPGQKDVNFYPGIDYLSKISNPILAIGNLEVLNNFDYLHNNKNYFLVSKKFASIIKSASLSNSYIIHSVRIFQSEDINEIHTLEIESLTERKWSDDFVIVQCRSVTDILDQNESEVARMSFGLYGNPPAILAVYHFVFRVEDDTNLPPLFQIPELTQYFVSNSAKALLEQKNIKGINFDKLP